jgi:aspartyl-tRNA(Asn)/glutamyl-tRNA(Gln) amidotransferase subunit A
MVASPLHGIPISIKDLFDVAGETTTAGSMVLKGGAPAARDAAIVRRLRARRAR